MAIIKQREKFLKRFGSIGPKVAVKVKWINIVWNEEGSYGLTKLVLLFRQRAAVSGSCQPPENPDWGYHCDGVELPPGVFLCQDVRCGLLAAQGYSESAGELGCLLYTDSIACSLLVKHLS